MSIPNTPAELLALNANQVFAEGLTPIEIVEKLAHHSDLGPAELIEVLQGITAKLTNFHRNVLANKIEENGGALPADQIYWAIDTQKMETIQHLAEGL